MRETGRIKKIENSRALIELEFKGGCAACSLNGICRAENSGMRELKLSVRDLDLKPGDMVEIETEPRSLLTAAFLIFILPLLLSAGAYFLILRLGGSSGLGLAGFFACFAVSLLLVSLIDKTAGRGTFFEPRIVRKI